MYGRALEKQANARVVMLTNRDSFDAYDYTIPIKKESILTYFNVPYKQVLHQLKVKRSLLELND